MKENSKNIELIYLKDELVGFYNGKEIENNTFEIGNICLKPEYQNKGIGTAILMKYIYVDLTLMLVFKRQHLICLKKGIMYLYLKIIV